MGLPMSVTNILTVKDEATALGKLFEFQKVKQIMIIIIFLKLNDGLNSLP